jgi:hypothetical protein
MWAPNRLKSPIYATQLGAEEIRQRNGLATVISSRTIGTEVKPSVPCITTYVNDINAERNPMRSEVSVARVRADVERSDEIAAI